MKLMEFFYFNDVTNKMSDDKRYSSENDISVIKSGDNRKIRLTLKQINQLRQQSEAHEFEQESEREFIKQMYARPAPEAAVPTI